MPDNGSLPQTALAANELQRYVASDAIFDQLALRTGKGHPHFYSVVDVFEYRVAHRLIVPGKTRCGTAAE